MSACGTTRKSRDVGFRAAVRGIADISASIYEYKNLCGARVREWPVTECENSTPTCRHRRHPVRSTHTQERASTLSEHLLVCLKTEILAQASKRISLSQWHRG